MLIRDAVRAGKIELASIIDYVQERKSVDDRQVSNNLYQLAHTGKLTKENGCYSIPEGQL